jgi:Rod binding domain-containing protein
MNTIGQINSPPLISNNEKLMDAAKKLEANFISEMLKSSGAGKSRTHFGGGAGEDQFSGFLVQEYATAMVEAGGIGLSESIYEALVKRGATQ